MKYRAINVKYDKLKELSVHLDVSEEVWKQQAFSFSYALLGGCCVLKIPLLDYMLISL